MLGWLALVSFPARFTGTSSLDKLPLGARMVIARAFPITTIAQHPESGTASMHPQNCVCRLCAVRTKVPFLMWTTHLSSSVALRVPPDRSCKHGPNRLSRLIRPTP